MNTQRTSKKMGEQSQPNEIAKFLHENIPKGEIELIRDYLDKQQIPDDECYYDEEMKSAAALAIECERFDIYKLLISKEICFGPHECIQNLLHGKPLEEKRNLEICDIHRDNIKVANPKHLMILIAKSSHSHDTSEINRPKFSERILKAFEELNAVKLIEPILQVVSTSAKLKIVFDFNRESVYNLDPRKNQDVMGTTYFKDFYIYVGAKGLLNEDEDYCQALGVLAHELCHFAINLLYDNSCKPYTDGDQVKMKLYKTIVDATESKKRAEKFVNWAYLSPHVVHEELIVRVPHLAAFYKDDDDKFKEVSENFNELFKFYKENTLVDLQREYPLMKAKKNLIDLNGTSPVMWNPDIETISEVLKIDSDSNDKFLYVSSNCPQLTISAIFQKFKVNIENGRIIIAEIKLLQDEVFFDYAIKAISLRSKPKILINCDGQGIDKAKKMKTRFNENGVNERVVFLCDQSRESLSNSNLIIKHSWNHMTENFQQKLLDKEIMFQGNEIQLGSLLTDLGSTESIPFNDFFSDRKITIGKIDKYENFEKFIERKFLRLDSKLVTWFKEDEIYDSEHGFSDVLESAEQHRMILLSDEPGMGKSTTFKIMNAKLVAKYPLCWVIYIDLKEHCKAFQVEKNILTSFDNCEGITKFLNSKVLETESFEAQIFAHLFNENRVVLLMDGLDEICPSFKNTVYDFMLAYRKYSKNQLWVSTRPHLVEELIEKLYPIIFKLKPFTKTDRRRFFEIAFKDEGQNIEHKLEMVEEFLNELEEKFEHYYSVSNPLIFKMIAECTNEDQSMKLSDANLYSVYEQFTIKMIERCMNKGPEAKKSIAKTVGKSNMIEFYQKEAFRICFQDELKVSKVIESCFESTSTPTLDDITRVGFIFSDYSGNFQFIHRTFAEFYVAKYFHEVIFQGKRLSDEELQLILGIFFIALKQLKNSMIMKLLDSALESYGATQRLTNQLIFEAFSLKIDSEVLHSIIEGGHFNLIKTSFKSLRLNPERLLLKNEDQNNVVMTAVQYNSIGFVHQFFDFLKGICLEKFKKMLFELNENNEAEDLNKLTSVSRESLTYIERLFALNVKVLNPEIKMILAELNTKRKDIFYYALCNYDPEVFSFVVKEVEGLVDRDLLVNILMEKDHTDKSLILMKVSYVSIAFVKNLFSIYARILGEDEFKKVLVGVDKDNQNILRKALSNLCNDDLEIFCFVAKEVKALIDRNLFVNLLMQSDSRGVNLLMAAVSLKPIAFVKHLFLIYACLDINRDEFKKMLAELNEENKNIFYYALCNKDSDVFSFMFIEVEALIDRDLFVNLLMQSDSRGVNLIMLAISLKSIAFVKQFFSIYARILNPDEFEKILTGVDKENQNIFRYALDNDDMEVLCFIIREVKALNERDFFGNLNLYFIYEQFTMKIFDRCMDKDPGALNSASKTVNQSNMIEFYQKEAFRICFHDELNVSEMIKSCFESTSTPTLDDIARVGFIFSDYSGNFQYVHKPFSEFYVAKYFHEVIFQGKYFSDEELQSILGIFFIALKQQEYRMIIKLLDSALESYGVTQRSTNQLISEAFSLKIDSEVLHLLIEGGHFNLIKTSFESFNLNPERLLLKNEDQNNIIMTAVQYNSIGFVQQFFDFLKGICLEKFKMMLFELNEKNKAEELKKLTSVSSESLTYIKRLFALNVKVLNPEIKKILAELNTKRKDIFYYALCNYDPEVFSFVVKEVEGLVDRDLLVNLLM